MPAKHTDGISRPRFKNVDHGWAWVIAVAGFFLHIIVGGHRRSMGLFFLELIEQLGSSKSETAIVVSVFYVSSLSTAPLATLLTKRISVRTVVASGGVSIGLAFLIAAFTSNLKIAILTVGAMSGIGSSFLHAPMLVLVGQYFERRRTFAIGICLAGGAMGAFIFPPVVGICAERYGYPGMMLMVSGMSLQGVIFAMLLRPPEKIIYDNSCDLDNEFREPILHSSEKENFEIKSLSMDSKSEEMEKYEMGNDENVTVTYTDKSGECSKELYLVDGHCHGPNNPNKSSLQFSERPLRKFSITPANGILRAWRYLKSIEVLSLPNFYIYSVAGALATEMLPLALYLIPPMCEDAGLDLEQQSLILLIMGAPDLIARLLIGVIADKYPSWRHDIFVLLLIGKAFLWIFVTINTNYMKLMVFAQITGLIGGAIFTLYLPILVDAVGIKHVSIIFSVSLVFEGLYCLVFPPVLAYVRDATGSWTDSCRVMTAVSLLAAILIIHDSKPILYLRRKILRSQDSL